MLSGQFDEALRRRKEAELSRAQLQQKIEALKQARSSAPRTGASLSPHSMPHQLYVVANSSVWRL